MNMPSGLPLPHASPIMTMIQNNGIYQVTL